MIFVWLLKIKMCLSRVCCSYLFIHSNQIYVPFLQCMMRSLVVFHGLRGFCKLRQCLPEDSYFKLLEFLTRDDPRIVDCRELGCEETSKRQRNIGIIWYNGIHCLFFWILSLLEVAPVPATHEGACFL